MPQPFGKILASWRVNEFDKHERSVGWYVFFGAIALGFLGFSIATFNYLFALIIVLVVCIVYIQGKSRPRKVTFSITTKGVKIGRTLYQFKEINDFWILYDPPEVKNLYFSFKGRLTPEMRVALNNQNPLEIRELLLDFIPEDLEREDESLTEVFSKWAKI